MTMELSRNKSIQTPRLGMHVLEMEETTRRRRRRTNWRKWRMEEGRQVKARDEADERAGASSFQRLHEVAPLGLEGDDREDVITRRQNRQIDRWMNERTDERASGRASERRSR